MTAKITSLSDTIIAAAISGLFSRIPMHPVDTVKTKLQVCLIIFDLVMFNVGNSRSIKAKK